MQDDGWVHYITTEGSWVRTWTVTGRWGCCDPIAAWSVHTGNGNLPSFWDLYVSEDGQNQHTKRCIPCWEAGAVIKIWNFQLKRLSLEYYFGNSNCGSIFPHLFHSNGNRSFSGPVWTGGTFAATNSFCSLHRHKSMKKCEPVLFEDVSGSSTSKAT